MNDLRRYLNSMSTFAQADFARDCGTSVGYLRKALSKGQRLSEGLCIDIERATAGEVTCEHLRPDRAEAFAYLRESACRLKPQPCHE
ncbi:YdaS family helix-turn-helix protein [Variovorax sp. J22P168]|uniref:transcriptional regulator n=1 Tax=Variovorax jilinensis TaxID=3053513 RepID=UPI0025754845|nr:YdaS family helix-turn-helix protein [Variovorax sp. J22P168]MDM0011971.1 YdaS family helix-turn-helix protein [Variovorax sp. J22P168]